jgi:hypothetical protein
VRSSGGAVTLLIAARCFVEALLVTALAALAHVLTSGREPMPVLPTTLVLFGTGLLLAMVMREAGGERRSSTIIVLWLVGAAAWGVTLPMRANADWFAVLSRLVLFGILGEVYLWRLLSIARGGTRWTDARNAVPFAGVAIAAASLMPGPIDREPFAPLALIGVAAAGLALSLARTTEELSLARGTTGKLRTSSATSAAVITGVVAIVAAAFVPSVQDALGRFGAYLAPIAGRIFYLIVLPFAYLAGYLIEFLRPLLSGRWPTLNCPINPVGVGGPGATGASGVSSPYCQPIDPAQDAEYMRQLEQTRPFVFGAIELIVVAIGVLVAIVLLDRMLRERRMELAEGATLERETADGISLMDTLRGLRPRGPRRRHAPREDGTAAGAIRVLYWKFLHLAERRGAGWREEYETPAEHDARLRSAESRWGAAAPVVRAFEDVRYGEDEPDRATVTSAREALRTAEASLRGS